MSTESSAGSAAGKTFSLSLDTWAVLLALVLALAVKLDIFKKVPW